MSRPDQPGELQLAILRVLWNRKEATVTEVHAELYPTLGLARTTVATVLTNLARKGLVEHRSEDRQFVYRTAIAEDKLLSSAVGEFVNRLFGGDPTALVSHLVTQRQIDPESMERIRALLDREAPREEESDAP